MVTLPVTRREFLVGVGALVVTPAVTHAQPPVGPVSLDEFMELSEALTDEVGPLRDEVGAQYQAALDPDALRQLVQVTVRRNNPPRTFAEVLVSGALNDPTNAATAQQILVYWYSGLVNGRTATFIEALAWDKTLKDVLGAEPPSEKIGFGKWSERP